MKLRLAITVLCIIVCRSEGAPFVVPPIALNANMTYVNAFSSNPSVNGGNLTNAMKAAAAIATGTAPVTVEVMPGTYITDNTFPSVMAASNIRQFWHPGAKWGNGGSGSFMWDNQAGTVTNFGVYGYGEFFQTNSVDLVNFTAANNNDFYFECFSMEVYGASAACFALAQGDRANIVIRDHAKTTNYDFAFGPGGGAGLTKFYLQCPFMDIGQDLFEFGQVTNWGDFQVKVGVARVGVAPNTASSTLIPGRAIVQVDRLELYNSETINSYPVNTTNGLLINTWIASHATNVVPPISQFGGFTSILLRNCRITGPTNADPIALSNGAPATVIPLTLENCAIDVGWNATNAVRSKSGNQQVQINGTLTLSRQVPFDTNVTVWSQKAIPLASSTTPVASAGAGVFTNLQTFIVTPNQLTNLNDAILLTASGTWNTALGGTTQILWTNTATGTIFDTGAQAVTNGSWQTTLKITRSGVSQQINDAWVTMAGVGSAWQNTNKTTLTSASLGAGFAVRLVCNTANNGQVTNNNWLVQYLPAQ